MRGAGGAIVGLDEIVARVPGQPVTVSVLGRELAHIGA